MRARAFVRVCVCVCVRVRVRVCFIFFSNSDLFQVVQPPLMCFLFVFSMYVY